MSLNIRNINKITEIGFSVKINIIVKESNRLWDKYWGIEEIVQIW
jgi:hypothetical protein